VKASVCSFSFVQILCKEQVLHQILPLLCVDRWIGSGPSFRLLRDDVAPARDPSFLPPWTPSEKRRVGRVESLRRLQPGGVVALLLPLPSERRRAGRGQALA
jgi:hypothetical protein